MKLFQDILCNLLEKEKIELRIPDLDDPCRVVDSLCYCALRRIQEILKDPALEDEECFAKIEAIVSLFEEMGSDCGSRHDFG